MSNRKTMKTKHSDIFNYYKDKCITEDGELAIEIGYDGYDSTKATTSNSIPVIEDWGEPCCFACNSWTEAAIENPDDDLKQLWDSPIVRKNLQRAHIIPDALGGADTPSNLFCLCRRCHRDSPDTIYKREFFRWVYLRRKEGRLTQRVMTQAIAECKKRNINPLFIHAGLTLDSTFKTINSHGGLIAESSFVASLVGGAAERQNALNRLLCASTGEDIKRLMKDFQKCFNIESAEVASLSN